MTIRNQKSGKNQKSKGKKRRCVNGGRKTTETDLTGGDKTESEKKKDSAALDLQTGKCHSTLCPLFANCQFVFKDPNCAHEC